MSKSLRLGRWLLVVGGLVAADAGRAAAQAGTLSPARVLTLSATRPGRLTVSVTAGFTQSIPSITDNVVNSFVGPTTIVTQWDVNPGQTNTVNLMAYFSAPGQALTGGTVQIPSSRVLGRVTTGLPTSYTAFTQNAVGGVGTAGGSLRLLSVNITGVNKTASRTDNLDLQLDLVGFGPLPPGTYSGTLNIRAVTQ